MILIKMYRFYLKMFSALGWFAYKLNGDAVFGSSFTLTGYSYLVMSLLLGLNFFSLASYLCYEFFNQTLSYIITIILFAFSLLLNYFPFKRVKMAKMDFTENSRSMKVLITVVLIGYILLTIILMISIGDYIRLKNIGYL